MMNFRILSSRINDARKHFIDSIKQHQPLPNRKLYICDQHFDPEHIKTHNSKIFLDKKAIPKITYVSILRIFFLEKNNVL